LIDLKQRWFFLKTHDSFSQEDISRGQQFNQRSEANEEVCCS